MKRTYPLVEIIWRDAASGAGWTEPGTVHRAPKIRTVGFLVHASKNSLTVATSVCPDDHYNATMTVPVSMVINRRVLE